MDWGTDGRIGAFAFDGAGVAVNGNFSIVVDAGRATGLANIRGFVLSWFGNITGDNRSGGLSMGTGTASGGGAFGGFIRRTPDPPGITGFLDDRPATDDGPGGSPVDHIRLGSINGGGYCSITRLIGVFTADNPLDRSFAFLPLAGEGV